MSGSEGERDRRPRRFVRTRRGRLIGGVCSGLGTQFGVDPLLFRIAFVGLALFAGVGLGLYLAILLLTPEEGASSAPICLRRSSWLTVLGIVAVLAAAGTALHAAGHAALGDAWGFGAGLGAVALAGLVAALVWRRLRGRPEDVAGPSADRRLARFLALATAVGAGLALLAAAGAWLGGTSDQLAAWAVVALGAALAVSAVAGRARRLVLPAVVFALPVAVVSAADVDLHGGTGARTYRPGTLSELRDEYRLGAGRLEIDLRDVAFPAGDTRLRVRLGVGELVVLVPREVCVATRARIGGGYVGALDRESGGLDVDWTTRPAPPPQTARLVLDGRVGLGALFVADRPFEGRGRGGGFRPGEYGTNDACRSSAGASR